MEKKSKSANIRILIGLFILIISIGVLLYTSNEYGKGNVGGRQNIQNSASGLYFQGKRLELEGKYDEALEVFKKSIQLNPNIGKAHLMLGVVYTRKGEFEEAAKEYKRALQLNLSKINRSIAHNNLGGTYLENMGLYNKAIAEYEASIKMHPKVVDFPVSSDSYHGLARAYLAKVDYEKAIIAAKKSVEFNPNSKGAYFDLGTAYLLKKDIVSAEAVYEKLKDIDKNLANKLYRKIEQVLNTRPQAEELPTSAAYLYNKAYSLTVFPPSDFYKDFTKKLEDVVSKGWIDNNEELKEILIKNRIAIRKFKKATELQKYDYTFGKSIEKSITAPPPRYFGAIILARLAIAEGMLYEKENKGELALDNYVSVLKFVDHLGQQKPPTLLSKLIEMAVQNLVYTPFTQYINRKDISTQGYQDLLNAFASLRDKKTGLESAFEEEREKLKNTARMVEDEVEEKGQYDESFYQKFYQEHDKLADEYYGYLITAFKENKPEIFKEKMDQFGNELGKEMKPLNLVWETLKGKMGFPQGIDSPTLVAKILISIGIPRYSDAITKYYVSLSELDILITAVAIKLHELKKGKLPDSLQELVPGYLSKLPEDPFDDFKPLKYKKTNNKWVVYSFGPNKKDDKAEVVFVKKTSYSDSKDAGDIVFSCITSPDPK